ncbi:ion transporter [Shouchella clausii]|uniref:ion transporter n=1 Tax=Shouchella clausii TaxID=79880 RepID=UPI000B97567D|nr:ion transporter [Shouchella clausii]PAD41350.1 voltage-gated sodium channel [Bacillus sp. 7520-S]AST98008.1 voltage-gated sodium channel [Shouchella clausii]MCR1289847.1 ion transporter [Shouchella clausii]MCY1106407.1 ion transporter [Shouchella clausii]MEB5475108.1 ion transporter [Shouchella clausii]
MLKDKFAMVVNHKTFQATIIILILFNAILVGLETYPSIYETNRHFFHFMDRTLLWLFTIEIAMRFAAEGRSFFRKGWNWFDVVIVLAGHVFVGGHFVTVLRILRVLRVLRAVSVVPSLRRLVDALIMTIPSLANILILMGIFLYIFAVIGTMLFSELSPEYFGNLQRTILTLFQIVTLDSWSSGLMRPLMEFNQWVWVYFVSFVLVGTFIIFNLFIGVIVNNVEKANKEETENAHSRELETIQRQLDELKEMLKKERSS